MPRGTIACRTNAQRYGRPHPVPVQPRRGSRSCYTVSPSFLINSRYSYTRYIDGNYPDQDGWDLAGLGSRPRLSIRSSGDSRALRFRRSPRAVTPLYRPGLEPEPVDTHDFALNATKVAGTHSIRFGGGTDLSRNSTNLGNSSGVLSFALIGTRGRSIRRRHRRSARAWPACCMVLPTAAASPSRQVMRNRSRFSHPISRRLESEPEAHPELGTALRTSSPMNERFNRSVKGFDFDAASPIEAAVKAAYAANPIPQIPAGQFRVRAV